MFLTLLASASRRDGIHANDYSKFSFHPDWKFVDLEPYAEFILKTQITSRGASVFRIKLVYLLIYGNIQVHSKDLV